MASLIFLGAVLFGLPSIALTGGITRQLHRSAAVIFGPRAYHSRYGDQFPANIRGDKGDDSHCLRDIIDFDQCCCHWAVWIGFGKSGVNLLRLWSASNNAFLPFMMLFFAFTGWEVAAGISEEFKRPEIDFPRAMFCSFSHCLHIVFYDGICGSGEPDSVFS